MYPVQAFFHFHHHHFDGNNGIIDQQAEGENQRPEEMRSKSSPVTCMTTKTAASVSGTASATTTPTRKPKVSRLTTMTTARAAKNLMRIHEWLPQ